MLLKITLLFCSLLVQNCAKPQSKNTQNIPAQNNTIRTGAENFERWGDLLQNKRVGLVANQTSIVRHEGQKTHHLLDYMLSKNINVTTVFAPEHGFRGTADAGEMIKDGKDTKTGLPIISLYGKNKKPTPTQLQGLDVVVFDLQDVGARFYTYISSLHYIMEACAENKIPVIVFDRPNPNGHITDGPVLQPEHSSFVGMHPVPVLHGLTIGEYALMINGEGWLANRIQCDLTVINCLNYKRDMPYELPVKPSPNLPNPQAINLYASLCFFEGTNVSVGRGTSKQFQIYGSPFLTNQPFTFTPKPNEGAKDPMHNGVLCFGEDLSSTPPVSQLELKWLLKAYQNTQDQSKFFNAFFTKLAGSTELQEQIIAGWSEEKIRQSWQPALERFKKIRKVYERY